MPAEVKHPGEQGAEGADRHGAPRKRGRGQGVDKEHIGRRKLARWSGRNNAPVGAGAARQAVDAGRTHREFESLGRYLPETEDFDVRFRWIDYFESGCAGDTGLWINRGNHRAAFKAEAGDTEIAREGDLQEGAETLGLDAG